MLLLHQFEISPFCDKVRRVLHYKGLDYQVNDVKMATAAVQIRKMNRIGRLPVLEHDGHHVADSTHIARYLDEKFPQPPLYPKDPRQRALCHVFEEWADESLYFFEVRLRFTFASNAKVWVGRLVERENPLIKAVAPFIIPGHFKDILNPQGIGRKPEELVLQELRAHLEALAHLLDGQTYLAGGMLSIADIAMVAQLHALQGTREGAEAIAGQPAVVAFMERLERATARPTAGSRPPP